MCTDALEHEPECVPILLIRARAHLALRRDLDAQADLRDVIRLDPQCASAFRLLGELAARRDETESASLFFREALRLDPGDREAADWLLVTDVPVRPAAVASKLPAPATAAGRFPRDTRLARGTQPPAECLDEDAPERPTQPYRSAEWRAPARTATVDVSRDEDVIALDRPKHTLPGRPATQRPAPRATPKPMSRPQIPELPGFGEYLVESGILTRERLRAAQAYQRSMKVQLSTAIVTLGLATPQRIEWAAVAHQSALGERR